MRIVNKKKFVKSLLTLVTAIVLTVGIVWIFLDFCKYPESYLTTWRYQLYRKIQQGDQEAIDYYQNVYLENNKILWKD